MTIHPFVAGLIVFITGFALCVSHYGAAEEKGLKEWKRGKRKQAKERMMRAGQQSTFGVAVTFFLTAGVILLAHFLQSPQESPEPERPFFPPGIMA